MLSQLRVVGRFVLLFWMFKGEMFQRPLEMYLGKDVIPVVPLEVDDAVVGQLSS